MFDNSETSGSHPTEIAVSPDDKLVYVACANLNSVVVFDAKSGQPREQISTALYPNAPNGSTPTSLALSADGKVLLVANSNNNNIAMIDVREPGKSRSLGFIPTGWYPTAVRFSPPAAKPARAVAEIADKERDKDDDKDTDKDHDKDRVRDDNKDTAELAGEAQKNLRAQRQGPDIAAESERTESD